MVDKDPRCHLSPLLLPWRRARGVFVWPGQRAKAGAGEGGGGPNCVPGQGAPYHEEGSGSVGSVELKLALCSSLGTIGAEPEPEPEPEQACRKAPTVRSISWIEVFGKINYLLYLG